MLSLGMSGRPRNLTRGPLFLGPGFLQTHHETPLFTSRALSSPSSSPRQSSRRRIFLSSRRRNLGSSCLSEALEPMPGWRKGVLGIGKSGDSRAKPGKGPWTLGPLSWGCNSGIAHPPCREYNPPCSACRLGKNGEGLIPQAEHPRRSTNVSRESSAFCCPRDVMLRLAVCR